MALAMQYVCKKWACIILLVCEFLADPRILCMTFDVAILKYITQDKNVFKCAFFDCEIDIIQ